VRQRYGESVRAEIAKIVQAPEEIEEELRHPLRGVELTPAEALLTSSEPELATAPANAWPWP